MNQNTSGQGSLAVIPDEIRGWNWGACLLTWIWAIGNSVGPGWIAVALLLGFVPFGSIVANIIFGVKGTEWAWRDKKWESIGHFKRTQRTWKIWRIVLACIGLAFVILLIIGMSMSGEWL